MCCVLKSACTSIPLLTKPAGIQSISQCVLCLCFCVRTSKFREPSPPIQHSKTAPLDQKDGLTFVAKVHSWTMHPGHKNTHKHNTIKKICVSQQQCPRDGLNYQLKAIEWLNIQSFHFNNVSFGNFRKHALFKDVK